MFLDVERHLQVGDLAAQRANEPDAEQQREHGEDADAEPGDRLRAELVGLEAVRREGDRDQRADQDDDAAPEEHARAPPATDLPDDVDQLLTGRRTMAFLSSACYCQLKPKPKRLDRRLASTASPSNRPAPAANRYHQTACFFSMSSGVSSGFSSDCPVAVTAA